MKLYTKDIFLNVVGGLKAQETGLDLAIAMGLLSSLKAKKVPEKTAVVGEVSLTGELRPVPQLKKRLQELGAMGMKYCICPTQSKLKEEEVNGVTPIYISQVSDLTRFLSMPEDQSE